MSEATLNSFLLIIAIIISTINMLSALIRTYYAIFTKKTYRGSVRYWNSWRERKIDVARQVLEEMEITDQEDLKKVLQLLEKRKKSTRRG